MREALSALTVRGRAFLAAGATAFVCALFLGHDELVRVGALLIALPLVTAFFLGRSRYRLGLVRSISPAQVSAGQQTRVQLDLSNDGRMPTGLLLLEDQIPYVHPAAVRGGPDGAAVEAQRRLHGALRGAGHLRGRADEGAAERPLRTGGTRAHLPDPLDARGHAAGGGPPPGAAVRSLDRVRRQPTARLRQRQRGGRHGPRVPTRRRPAPRALAQQRARRRADGPS